MNVLPVLVDLSPPKPDLPSHAAGSSVGEFAHILDQKLSGTFMGGYAPGGSPAPSARYVSPTDQGPAPRQQPNPPPEEHRTHADASPREPARAETQRSTGRDPQRSERNSTPRQDTSGTGNRTSKSGDTGSRQTDTAVKSKKSSAPADKHSTKKTKSSAEEQSGGTKSAQNEKNQQSRSAPPDAAGIPFPGALILAGAHKGTASAGKHHAASSGKVVAKLAAADLLKGAGPAKNAQQAPALAEAKKKTEAPAKGANSGGKPVAQNGVIPSQLLAPLPSSTSAAAPQNLGAAAQSAPGYSNAPQEPGAAAGQNTASNQTAGITVIDLRQNNQNGSSSTGQNGNQGHSNDGGNVRLFQLADGGTAGAMKMNAQGGMARAAGAPSTGQGFSALTDQIVKQTGILLKNNNSGEIRLLLKPEHLGNLRIKLDLNNSTLSGKIVVQNHEALKLVQQNLDTLYRALRDSGFTATELNVSVGGRDNGEKSRERSSPLPSMRAIGGVKGFDNQAPALETAGSYYSLVNLMI